MVPATPAVITSLPCWCEEPVNAGTPAGQAMVPAGVPAPTAWLRVDGSNAPVLTETSKSEMLISVPVPYVVPTRTSNPLTVIGSWCWCVPSADPVNAGTPAGQAMVPPCVWVAVRFPVTFVLVQVGTPAGQAIVTARRPINPEINDVPFVPAGVKAAVPFVPAGVKAAVPFVPAGVKAAVPFVPAGVKAAVPFVPAGVKAAVPLVPTGVYEASARSAIADPSVPLAVPPDGIPRRKRPWAAVTSVYPPGQAPELRIIPESGTPGVDTICASSGSRRMAPSMPDPSALRLTHLIEVAPPLWFFYSSFLRLPIPRVVVGRETPVPDRARRGLRDIRVPDERARPPFVGGELRHLRDARLLARAPLCDGDVAVLVVHHEHLPEDPSTEQERGPPEPAHENPLLMELYSRSR